jgi:hypothetical protein
MTRGLAIGYGPRPVREKGYIVRMRNQAGDTHIFQYSHDSDEVKYNRIAPFGADSKPASKTGPPGFSLLNEQEPSEAYEVKGSRGQIAWRFRKKRNF